MSDPEKARHYIEALDAARCNGQWQEIPELVRKIGKHAAKRRCLCLTAQSEYRLATLSPQRPQTASSLASSDLSQIASQLQSAIEGEEDFTEDQFQARVCLAWLYSVQGESSQVLSTLSTHDIRQAIEKFTNIVSPTAKWTHVCVVKGAYLRGTAIEKSGNTKEAAQFYELLFEYLSKSQSTVGITLESDIWTERLLTRHISLASRHVNSNEKNPHNISKSKTFRPTELLGSFRLWSEYRSDRQYEKAFSLGWVWKAYYDILSILLQHQISKPIFKSKAQQYMELQRVQAVYEGILMSETHFPQANQSNAEIDRWVDQVVANWRALLIPSWRAEDLGQGGHMVLGKNVLEILYRSAMKSFQSPKILRHLFTVHAELGEFKLAGKALDTYLEIIGKGKARIEKSGEIEPGFDDDTTALCTAAEGIKMLCNYGNRAEVEKALEFADVLQSWISRVNPPFQGQSEPATSVEVSAEDNPGDLIDNKAMLKSAVPGRALALAYRAIGISYRSWSRLTYEESSRSELLAKAVMSFRAALRPEYGNQEDIEILHSLAYAFCEQRDVDAAITTLKEAISLGSVEAVPRHNSEAVVTSFRARATLLKCWHLMALLLSARQNFEKAMASCEAAEQLYGGKVTLYGDTSALNSLEGIGISERKGLIELKMTQLALSEVISGSEEAVNSSSELLGLYAKLFKYSDKETPIGVLESTRVLSKKIDTGSPHRSLRESILGYPKDRRSKLAIGSSNGNDSVRSLEPQNEATGAPAIAITSDETVLPQDLSHHNHFLGRHESNKLKKRHSRKSLQGSSHRRSRTSSPLRPATSDGGGQHYLTKRGELSADGPSDSLSPPTFHEYTAADEVGLAISHDLPSSSPLTPTLEPSNPAHALPSSTSQNMDRKNPNTFPVPSKSSPTNPPEPVNILTLFTLPEPRYPPQIENRHGLSLLAQVWCQISEIYRRADLTSDAQGAIHEARTHVRAIETAIATHEGSSVVNFNSPGYGGLISLAELWGDVLSESGALHASLGDFAKASEAFETALRWDSNHSRAIVGLSVMLLDSYENNNAIIADLDTKFKESAFSSAKAQASLSLRHTPTLAPILTLPVPITGPSNAAEGIISNASREANLMALSARDRAFKLLSGLTKSGRGWDDSEAWFALARAYELSRQEEKAKNALWWVVELEEGRGIRDWKVANAV